MPSGASRVPALPSPFRGTNRPPLRSAKRKKGKKAKAGSFEALELHPPLFHALKRKGYRLPTPVQRKAIPLVLAGACRPSLCFARSRGECLRLRSSASCRLRACADG
jgi:hypothetical protein